MKICHYKSLRKTGSFRHKSGAIHDTYRCDKCGERYQYSPASGWYKIRGRSKEPRTVMSFRGTAKQRADMIADAGSVQGWVDKWYAVMKNPR